MIKSHPRVSGCLGAVESNCTLGLWLVVQKAGMIRGSVFES